MVHARLHIICGNCGSLNNFEWKHIEKFVHVTYEKSDTLDYDPATVSISCKNCSTIHDLNDYGKEEKN